jgi:hypothetical protein
MFFLHSQLLYFLIVFFSQHVSASMGHPQVSTKTVISVDDLSLCQRIRLSTFIYMYATQQDAPHRNEPYVHTDYRLILTKDRPDLLSERADSSETALAKISSNSKLQSCPLVREGPTK